MPGPLAPLGYIVVKEVGKKGVKKVGKDKVKKLTKKQKERAIKNAAKKAKEKIARKRTRGPKDSRLTQKYAKERKIEQAKKDKDFKKSVQNRKKEEQIIKRQMKLF